MIYDPDQGIRVLKGNTWSLAGENPATPSFMNYLLLRSGGYKNENHKKTTQTDHQRRDR